MSLPGRIIALPVSPVPPQASQRRSSRNRTGLDAITGDLSFFPVFASHLFAGTIHAEVWPIRSGQSVIILLEVRRKRDHVLFATQHLAREALSPTRRDLSRYFQAPCGCCWCASRLSLRQRGVSRSQAVAVRRPPDTHGSTHDAAERGNAGTPAQAEKITRQIDPMGAPESPRRV